MRKVLLLLLVVLLCLLAAFCLGYSFILSNTLAKEVNRYFFREPVNDTFTEQHRLTIAVLAAKTQQINGHIRLLRLAALLFFGGAVWLLWRRRRFSHPPGNR